MADTTFTNADLAKCARREVGFRRRVFPRMVERRDKTQEAADREIGMMEAIAAHFEARAEAEKQAAAPTLL